ncbi:septal ring lytic transglycosylase RlpA family protein [Halomonas sp. PR-M31]|uniref:septal ring lytic transglycosylase RlpA family protein n=1 Tax=Halomonas sp. PR-M31 TaxID=1471202 RepID=UPI0006524022|nr:septal ring lytic transglycosylase RlpA family protein [Halomonas sp. PR-M31]
MSRRLLYIGLACTLLAGCAGGGGSYKGENASNASKKSAGGRYAMNSDAYPELPPDVSDVPDAVPRVEPRSASGNRPTYQVWGKTYHVLADPTGYEKRGTASWYGQKFHGYATASGEIYDMYKMSAAHRSLPLPTYARVTNTDNGRSVIVKVNDRGPFHSDRLIDLSYAAAARLDILGNGTGHVEVEAIDPAAWQARQQRSAQPSAPPRVAQAAVTTAQPVMTPSAPANGAQASRGQSSQAQAASTSASLATSQAASAGGSRMYLQVAALGSAAGAQALQMRLQNTLDRPVRVDSDTRMHRVQVGPVNDQPALEALRQELKQAGFAQAFTIRAQE